MVTLILFIGAIAVDEGWERFKERLREKEMVVITTLFVLSGPMGCFALVCTAAYHTIQDRVRKKCNLAMHKWETKARRSLDMDLHSYTWHTNEKFKEARHNALREHVECLTDKEISLMISVSDEVFKVEPALRDALVDEVLHRKIMNHE